jgi:outer membrane lipoprotein carrier protein
MMNRMYPFILRNVAATFFILLISLTSFSQSADFKNISDSEEKILIEKIKKSSNAVSTLKCDFIQSKKLSFLTDLDVSNGVMYYSNPQKLRWEYKSPNPYVFVLNQSKIYLHNSQGTSSYNTGSNRMYKAISQLIIGFINGQGLQDNTNFKSDFFSNNKQIFVKLTPVNSDIKKMFTSVNLYLDINTFIAGKIVMNECSGDVTTLTLYNIKRNSSISDDLFILK